MAYKNKTQAKRALRSIKQKAFKLAYVDMKNLTVMSVKDFITIDNICDKYLKKL